MGVLGTAFSPKMVTKADLGWVEVAGSTYNTFKSNDYENAYPSITKITNKFMMIRPYAVDGEGEKITTPTAVINALYHPNILNSSVEFREALALMYLVHAKTHILVWRKEGATVVAGGDITPTNIAGFSFMEGVTSITVGGKTTFTISSENGSKTYTDKEVITLRGLNPYKINTGGFSATQAACKWTTVDDYIAEYQKGFFENGAVPSGQFRIVAPTTQEFNDSVDKMIAKHQGASNNGGVDYVHVPIDPATNKTVQPQVEWLPYSVSNRELSLKDLFEQANKKIDSTYGVPASIRGVGENNNYATARTDQQNFMENVVDPLALKIWTGFTHELNRITGGLGVAISYDIEIPQLADEEKVKEERDKIRDDRVQAWLDKGYSLTSIKEYLETGDLEALELAEVTPETDDDPDVDEGSEVKNSPDPDKATEAATRTNPKAQSVDPSVDAELVPYENDISEKLNAQITKQASRASDKITDEASTEEEDDSLADEIAAILLLLLLMRGSKQYNEGLTQALAQGLSTSNTSKFTATLADVDETRMLEVVKGFNGDTDTAIQKTITKAKAEGKTSQEIKTLLAGFAATQADRVKRFAQNESWRMSELAGVKAFTQLGDQLNETQTAGTYKTWNIQPNACPVCIDYAGVTIPIKSQFFGGIDAPPAHVVCRCMLTYSIVRENPQNKLEMHCVSCDRFIGLTDKKHVTDMIKCPNTKCKALQAPLVRSQG